MDKAIYNTKTSVKVTLAVGPAKKRDLRSNSLSKATPHSLNQENVIHKTRHH